MPEVTVPTAPPLATLPNVELIHTGTWKISTGEWTVTVEDLAAAVAAMECPAVRRPVLKLGHTDPRFDGEPAVGWIANMATAEDGRALVGDYTGMPGWLGDVIASAYPDRSVEGQYDFRCQIGHTHPFVLTGVALLGVTPPGVGTLESLQDVAALYGVAASQQANQRGQPGTHVTFSVAASNISVQEVAVPNPRPLQINAAVTSEDVRRAFYNGPGDSWDQWIESMQLDPLELIVMNDSTGKRARVPVVLGDGEGEDAVSFGTPVDVVIRYEDAPKATAAGNSASPATVIAWASRAESRPTSTAPATPPAATPAPVAPTAAEAAARIHNAPVRAANQKGSPVVEFSTDQLADLRAKLGLAEDAPLGPEQVLAALGSSQTTTTPPTPAPTPTDTPPKEPVAAGVKQVAGTIVIDSSAWEAREQRIKKLEAEAAKRAREERDKVVDEAIRAGKFEPARRDHWVRLWDADPEGTRTVLAGLAKNVIPVEEIGVGDDGDSVDDEFRHLFPPNATVNGA